VNYKIIRRLTALVVAAGLLAGCASTPPPQDRLSLLRGRFLDPNGPVMVVAHRACWTTTAENSLAAIDRCRDLGVDMVELDVQRTRDGQLVLMHDSTVDRTTNGTGRVADLTLTQIKALRLKAGAGGPAAPLTGQSPPTFAEAMRAARGMLVNVDAKGEVNLQAAQELEGMGLIDQAVIKSAAPADDPALLEVLTGRTLLFMPILRERDGRSLAVEADRYAQRPPAFEIVFTSEAFFRSGAPALRSRPARVWVNTLQPGHAAGHVDADAVKAPEAHWGRLIDMGANIIQTDAPADLIAWLKRCGCGGARP